MHPPYGQRFRVLGGDGGGPVEVGLDCGVLGGDGDAGGGGALAAPCPPPSPLGAVMRAE